MSDNYVSGQSEQRLLSLLSHPVEVEVGSEVCVGVERRSEEVRCVLGDEVRCEEWCVWSEEVRCVLDEEVPDLNASPYLVNVIAIVHKPLVHS